MYAIAEPLIAYMANSAMYAPPRDAGDIVGLYADQSGVLHGFEAVPSTGPVVPEPGTRGMLGAGLLGLAGVWRCQLRLRH